MSLTYCLFCYSPEPISQEYHPGFLLESGGVLCPHFPPDGGGRRHQGLRGEGIGSPATSSICCTGQIPQDHPQAQRQATKNQRHGRYACICPVSSKAFNAELKLPSHTRWADVQALQQDVDFKTNDAKSPGILAGYILIRTPFAGLQILKQILKDMVCHFCFCFN